MMLARLSLSLLLTLALAGAPVAQTLAMAMPMAPADAHAAHHAAASDQQPNPCQQHTVCNGQCCAHCVQCIVGLTFFPIGTEFSRPTLTPFVYSLAFSSPSSPRERPPRHFPS